MQKIVDVTNPWATQPIRGGRQEKWWLHHPGRLTRTNTDKSNGALNASLTQQDIISFLQAYNLKGIEFGQWLTQAERLDYMAALASCMIELSYLFGKNVGIDCNLGIALGARGIKGAAAHYEPAENVINLTKRNGAGTLAHEYGHALDFNIGAYIDRDCTSVPCSYGQSIAKEIKPKGGVFRKLINEIVNYCNTCEGYTIIRKDPKRWHGDYFLQRTEIFARFVEASIAYDGCLNRFLCRNKDVYNHDKNPMYITIKEYEKIKPTWQKLCKEIKKKFNEK